jgi:hypothetical protein
MFKPPASMQFVRRTVWEDLTPEQMVERYAAGASLDDLGMLAGIGAYRVRRLLVSRGVTIRAVGRGAKRQTRNET